MAVRIEHHAEPIPGYRLLSRLGGGGFGEVWKCEAPGGLLKAIKFVYGDLSTTTGEDGHRAEQELKALSRVKTVRHPYILSLERYEVVDGQLIIVMELADRNLWDRYKECRARGLPGIPRDELLGYLEETAEALDLMNEEYQLQHLDIKPHNLFLVHQHIKVADFGLVKDLEGMKATVTGGVTPIYAAPETFDGWVSRFSDQYSLAIVYQELLTGQRPFNGSSVRQLILQHLQAAPNLAPLPTLDRPVIARALAKNPEQRHPSCQALALALREVSEIADLAQTAVREESPGPPSSSVSQFQVPQIPQTQEDAAAADLVRTVNIRLRPTTDSSSGSGSKQRLRPSARPSSQGQLRAPPEISSDGALFPAVVVGVGQMGLQVLQALRETLAGQLRAPAELPLRLLLLDTDPEIIRQSNRCERAAARLSPADVLLAPLNRPSYYLKTRDSRPPLEQWLNQRMLYRIPRAPVTTGLRALGRLAFCDNYRSISRRLKAELDAVLDPQVLASAARSTGLGVRSNRPRVYVVCALGGGTGSGMFLDFAYTARALLDSMGYEQPEVVALLLAPPVDRSRTRTLVLGNAYAALMELSYFGRPDTCFTARYVEREPPIEDPAPPFIRTVLLPLPDETDEPATREAVGLAGQYLFRDLCSLVGREADLARAGLSGPPWDARGLHYQTFGLFQLTWPRQELCEQAARRLCLQLVQRWMSKDSKPVRAAVQQWVQEQWTQKELGAESFIARLGEACVQRVGRPPEALLQEAVQPLVDRYGTPEARPSRGKAPQPAEVDPEEFGAALLRLEELLGKPGEDGAEPAPTLVQAIREAGDEVMQHWGQMLAELPVRLIEEPEFRLAGAEEAVRQLVASIEQALQHHEPLLKDLSTQAREVYTRLRMLAPAPVSPSRGGTRLLEKSSSKRGHVPDPVELLRAYAKSRYQSLVLGQVASALVTLRGHLADEMREINYCRVRLTELQRMLQEAATATAAGASPRPPAHLGRHIFPSGCKNLTAALDEVLPAVGAEALGELDGRLEAMFKQQFRALVHICMSEANMLPAVYRAMLETTVEFVGGLMPRTDVARLFLEQHRDEEEAREQLATYFDEAAPPLLCPKTPSGERVPEAAKGSQLYVLATPTGEAGDRLRNLASEAMQGTEVHMVRNDPNPEDSIVLYRETCHLPLSDLELMGPVGRDIYSQLSASDTFTPHNRTDVDFLAPEAGEE